jgi:aromatic-amino-acid transaminase
MLESLQTLPPDPLLKIMRAAREDKRPGKIDLGVGVYCDEHGKTPVMRAIKEAERRLFAQETTKTYVAQQGDVEFLRLMQDLVIGPRDGLLPAIQAVGGTGALRVACDVLKLAGVKRVLLPSPSWPNHPPILKTAGLEHVDVPAFDVGTQQLDLARLVSAMDALSPGDAVLLQACCHNPLGADFTLAQWDVIADELQKRGLIPFLDLAYQGLGDGVAEDVAPLRRVLAAVPEAIVTISGSKTFGVYKERVGAVFVQCPPAAREAVLSNMFHVTRRAYSMPPDHGASLVRILLSDPALRADWESELADMRARMKATRDALAAARVNSIPMNMIGTQHGMFTTLPLSLAQITRLREERAVHITEAGRMNIAGLREADVPRFVDALRAVAD